MSRLLQAHMIILQQHDGLLDLVALGEGPKQGNTD